MILHFPLRIWQQMHEYIAASLPNEVTGIGAINIINPNEVVVTEIFLPHQKANSCYSEFNQGELGKIVSNFVRNNPAAAGDLCFRWHSHGHGKVFWSNIDENDINGWKGNYVFNLVTNAKGDHLIRLDFFKPFRITIPDIKLQIDYPKLDPTLRLQYLDEVRTKVTVLPERTEDIYSADELELMSLLQKGGEESDQRLL